MFLIILLPVIASAENYPGDIKPTEIFQAPTTPPVTAVTIETDKSLQEIKPPIPYEIPPPTMDTSLPKTTTKAPEKKNINTETRDNENKVSNENKEGDSTPTSPSNQPFKSSGVVYR